MRASATGLDHRSLVDEGRIRPGQRADIGAGDRDDVIVRDNSLQGAPVQLEEAGRKVQAQARICSERAAGQPYCTRSAACEFTGPDGSVAAGQIQHGAAGDGEDAVGTGAATAEAQGATVHLNRAAQVVEHDPDGRSVWAGTFPNQTLVRKHRS